MFSEEAVPRLLSHPWLLGSSSRRKRESTRGLYALVPVKLTNSHTGETSHYRCLQECTLYRQSEESAIVTETMDTLCDSRSNQVNNIFIQRKQVRPIWLAFCRTSPWTLSTHNYQYSCQKIPSQHFACIKNMLENQLWGPERWLSGLKGTGGRSQAPRPQDGSRDQFPHTSSDLHTHPVMHRSTHLPCCFPLSSCHQKLVIFSPMEWEGT